jgi:GT2 family glycosyltransferase
MISAVIVNWNSGPLLETCVASLRRHAAGCEIVVVDNASEDGSADFLSPGEQHLILIRNSQNPGFAAASNAGWRRANGDPVLFLNPDTECRPESVALLAQTLLQDPSVWACAGLLLPPSPDVAAEVNVRRLPTFSSTAVELLLLDEIIPWNPWTSRHRMKGENLRDPREVEQPAAACLMLRRDALNALEGFDERFRPAWFEDVDLCARIRSAGGRIVLQPAARFLHHGGYSLHRLPYGRFLEYYHTNQIRYFAKHYGDRVAARIRALIVAGMRLRAVLSLLHPLARGSSRLQSFRLYQAAARRFAIPNEDTA